MPYPVDHDTRNRLSAVPMIVSPLQTRGVGTRLLPEVRGRAEGRSADKWDGSRSRGERTGRVAPREQSPGATRPGTETPTTEDVL